MELRSVSLARVIGLPTVLVTVGAFLSGCGFVAGLFGIQFETYYSPEQREVFRTNVELGLSNFGTEVPPPTPAEERDLEESGITICELLRDRSRSEVKEEFVRQVLAETPTAPVALAERFAEVFISASTAQGSLCSELR